ncbi:hypothetical protein D3C81_1806400 [compost metagenome]
MLFAAEIGQCVSDKERFDIAHESVGRGRHTADVRVHTGDQQLIAARLFEHLFQRRTVERAVAPFHQHRIGFVRSKRRDNTLLLW